MELKNFTDIISCPQNIGRNKWKVSNFSDLEVSNDYLHSLKLRYDNRWLKTYWDSKLKEVEKEQNFYIAAPISKKKDAGLGALSASRDSCSIAQVNSSINFYNSLVNDDVVN